MSDLDEREDLSLNESLKDGDGDDYDEEVQYGDEIIDLGEDV